MNIYHIGLQEVSSQQSKIESKNDTDMTTIVPITVDSLMFAIWVCLTFMTYFCDSNEPHVIVGSQNLRNLQHVTRLPIFFFSNTVRLTNDKMPNVLSETRHC